MTGKDVTAAFVIIGNEILSGRTKDANLNYLATFLNERGVQLREVRVIPDITKTIIDTINDLKAQFDYLFTSGGIGPTHDDITSASIAEAFGTELYRHPDAEKLLHTQYIPEDRTPARMKMADVPKGASLIDNLVSKAPGFQIENVFVLAGVPKIFQAMLDELSSRLVGGTPVQSVTVSTNLGEGVVAEGLEAIQNNFPDMDVGSYPYFRSGVFGTSLVMRSKILADLDLAAEQVRVLIRSLGQEPIEGNAKENG
ncbi:molybdopterin-binding protein [Alphaproteobacteria bacterium]|nr:molybdopterin-binding protein [Alphaproteobacteria bacterium]